MNLNSKKHMKAVASRSDSGGWAALSLLGALLLGGARFHWSASWMLLASLVGTAFAFFVLRACTFYPGIHRGGRWAMFACLCSLFLFCDAVGRVGFQTTWRRIYGMAGPRAEYQDRGARWSVTYPGQWIPREIATLESQTVIFLPQRLTPAIQFTIMRRPRRPGETLPSFVKDYYARLNKNPETVIEDANLFIHQGVPAYRDVQLDATKALPLRQENMFLADPNNVYLVSMTAVPAWFEQFPEDLRFFLNSFRLNA